ncbi:flagellar assembly protein FliH [Sulfurimonas sp. SAG-AH-194-L11]|nr:flagellar assembly protein FliH [Sulfurimonas sp. SAG-AH-194-L11]MDF1876472.1 flagellar assembly protein FliH [Sulfurimonas sp. SAG-AH-194-L11]
MAQVISENNLAKHNVNKYNFKVISNGKKETQDNHSSLGEELTPRVKIGDVDSSALSSSSKESLIESLMQKTDEMSSNFIKLQMKLEQKEEEHAAALTKAKEEAFAEGMEAGIAKAKEDFSRNASQNMDLFASSVKKLEESANEFEVSLEGIKKELITAALDIAKEVVRVEIGVSANEIAKVLSDELLKDLQSASKITLKVNPNNHGAISEHVGKLDHISVVSDSAISEGGVIVLSDAGNIDSQITKRFERVRRAALSE